MSEGNAAVANETGYNLKQNLFPYKVISIHKTFYLLQREC